MLRTLMAALVAVALATVIMVAPASAKNTTLCYKAHGLRAAVVKKHGKRAPGRNICRFGVRSGHPASTAQKARYVRALRRLVAPPPAYLAVGAGSPAQPPAGTLSRRYAATGLASCIVQAESTNNPLASNGTHSGLAGWSAEAWRRHGGLRFAPTPTQASYQQQLQVLSDGLARFGCRDWCPFDRC